MAFLGSLLAWICMLVLSSVISASPVPPEMAYLQELKDYPPTVEVPTPVRPNIGKITPHIGIPTPSINPSPLSKPKDKPRGNGALQGDTLVGALFSGGMLGDALGGLRH